MDGLILVHAVYVPELSEPPISGFLLWGEGAVGGEVAPERHPRAIEAGALEEALRPLGLGAAPGGAPRETTASLALPARGGWPLAPSSVPRESGAGGPPALRWFDVPGVRLTPVETLEFVPYLAATLRARPQGLSTGDDLDYWAEAARWAFDLLHRRRVAPSADGVRPVWRPVLSDPVERDRLQRFVVALPPAVRTASSPALRGGARPGPLFPAPARIVRLFLEEITDAAAREFIRDVIPAERRRAGAGPEAAVAAALATVPPHPLPPDVLARLREYSLPLLEPLPEGALVLGIRVLPPPAEEPDLAWRLRYHLASGDDPPVEIDAAEIWEHPDETVRRAGRLFLAPQEAFLARLSTAAAISPAVARSLEERHPVGAHLTVEEAHRFLTHEAPLLSESGTRVLLPGGGRLARVTLRLRAGEAGRESALTRFGLDTLVDFDWQVAVGDAVLTPAEFEELAARRIPLVAVRGEWVLLDREHLERTLRLFDRRPGGRTTLGEFLRLAGGLDAEAGAYPVETVAGDGWLGTFLEPTEARRRIVAFTPPGGLAGTLRPYQERGVAWMRYLTARGLGACLADDMGLGKTIQFLAVLLAARESGEAMRPSLLVCPTSVAENWLNEAARFSPDLAVAVHHGPDRAAGAGFTALLAKTDLLVTTYGLAHRDRALLGAVEWEYVALDEAQNVKNPSAAQSRAVRALKARRRAALTGTPMENRLSELKSIFDFLNPGLLGTDEVFRRTFAIPIERERDAEATDRLRRLTAPFLLRRAKTDPGVVADLPEKIETKEFVGLTREQAVLYRATTRSLLSGIGSARGRIRRARVLLLLLRLKQICDHPALVAAGEGRLGARSAKLTRLISLLEETNAEKRPALVFTQFAEMGKLLVRAAEEHFGTEVLFLHGAVPRRSRAEMVRRFQEDEDAPLVFVVSLRAGGSGLNLTRASHVFHFDRWWNPAVEEQATDRAFRIGQTRNVQVHKFVCRGTLEERIDRLLDEKRLLARSIVGSGETWLAAMSDAELADLVALSREAVEMAADG
jgi:superfamily II DNA or RNA helicase